MGETQGEFIVDACGVDRRFGRGRQQTQVLHGVDLRVRQGAFVALMGPSGSGKSTLLNCLAGLDRPDAGEVRIGEILLSALDETELTMFRRDRLGFVFQDYGLLAGLTARQNVELPSRVAERPIDKAWLSQLAERTGIGCLLQRRPPELSGGQQQRVAITRAMLGRPEVVIADEPTGALDVSSSAEVLALLRETSRGLGQTVVMVTHDPAAAAAADVVHFLVDGRITHMVEGPTTAGIAEEMARLGPAPE